MPHLIKSFKIIARDFIRAGEVSMAVQGLLKTIGFDPETVRRVAVCAYESEMNVVMHGGSGNLFGCGSFATTLKSINNRQLIIVRSLLYACVSGISLRRDNMCAFFVDLKTAAIRGNGEKLFWN